MDAKKTITMLTEKNANILTVTDGKNHRRLYVNSESGRADLVAFEPEEIVNEVMAMWGNTPTVEEIEYIPPQYNNTSSSDSSSASSEDVWDEIAMAISTGVNEV